MKASEVLKNVEDNFLKNNHFASQFPVEYPKLWDFCLKVVADSEKMNTIIAANNSATPITPVETLAGLYLQENNCPANYEFGPKADVYMGFLMGYVFKNVLHYTLLEENEKIPVNKWGIKTAALYTGGLVTKLDTAGGAQIKASAIIKRVQQEHGPYGILDDEELWQFCKKVIADADKMNKILYQNNELDIPPVQALLDFYQEEVPSAASKILPDNVSLGLGSLMGFIFQNILGYKIKIAFQPVSHCLGIQTAAVFCDGKFLRVEPGLTKEEEIIKFLKDRIIDPISNTTVKLKGIYVIHKMKNLRAADMIKYFHNAKADETYEEFEHLASRNNIPAFESIVKEFDERFNKEWLKA